MGSAKKKAKKEKYAFIHKAKLSRARQVIRHVLRQNGYAAFGMNQKQAISIFCMLERMPRPSNTRADEHRWMVALPTENYHVPHKNKVAKSVSKAKGGFYDSKAWLTLKRKILRFYGLKCMKCGVTKTELHVDHILPRSKFPKRELDPANLQVLCKSCNFDKLNRHYSDYRSTAQRERFDSEFKF